MSNDPLGHRSGVNLLEYAKSRPSIFIDPMGLFAIPTGGVVLSNCKSGSFPLAGEWVGVGLAAGISLDLVARVCDCCGPRSGFVKRGWVEGGLNGTITLGGGFGTEAVILGLRIELALHLAEVTFTMLDITGVSSDCGDSSINMSDAIDVTAGLSVGGGFLPFGIEAGGGVIAHAASSAYVSSGGFGASYELGVEADVWWTWKIFITRKNHFPGYPISFAGKSGGVKCSWALPPVCTTW